jgi:hypothetical protein
MSRDRSTPVFTGHSRDACISDDRQYALAVAEAQTIADVISRQLPDVKRGSLVVFGDIFGGRIDNVHTVRSARAVGTPQRLIIEFDDDEILEVWDPEGAIVSATDLRIDRATKVRWEWFYYGRPKTPENRYFIEHVNVGETITTTTNVDWAPLAFHPSSHCPAVEIVGSF